MTNEIKKAVEREIEVTPEMIEVGEWVFENNVGVISTFSLVREVYIAMARLVPTETYDPRDFGAVADSARCEPAR